MKLSSWLRLQRPRYKRYTRHSKNSKHEVLSWIQRRCTRCGKFIGGMKQFLCEECYNESRKEQWFIKEIIRKETRRTIRKIVNQRIPNKIYRIIDCSVRCDIE
jgi:hypothetical protein